MVMKPRTPEALASALDAALIRAVQGGLPLVERPYAALGAAIGLDESAVLARLGQLLANGVIKRLGVVVSHRELGYRSNAMVVWDLPDDQVDGLGDRIGTLPFVTLCYRRPRRLPDWPYNLFTMIHGRDRRSVLAQVESIKDALGLREVPCATLFSGRRFKQRGARYGASDRADATRPTCEPRAGSESRSGSASGGLESPGDLRPLLRPVGARGPIPVSWSLQ
jgi:DNA-binding Lrp family transcriptional regulator